MHVVVNARQVQIASAPLRSSKFVIQHSVQVSEYDALHLSITDAFLYPQDTFRHGRHGLNAPEVVALERHLAFVPAQPATIAWAHEARKSLATMEIAQVIIIE